MTCSICSTGFSSYKCPTCEIPYCSVKCWRIHRDQKCRKEVCDKKVLPSTLEYYNFKTEDTVPIEKLKALEHSEGVKFTLKNPHVCTILDTIDKSPNPTNVLKEAMLEPIFVQFVEECLKVVEPQPEYSSDSDLE